MRTERGCQQSDRTPAGGQAGRSRSSGSGTCSPPPLQSSAARSSGSSPAPPGHRPAGATTRSSPKSRGSGGTGCHVARPAATVCSCRAATRTWTSCGRSSPGRSVRLHGLSSKKMALFTCLRNKRSNRSQRGGGGRAGEERSMEEEGEERGRGIEGERARGGRERRQRGGRAGAAAGRRTETERLSAIFVRCANFGPSSTHRWPGWRSGTSSQAPLPRLRCPFDYLSGRRSRPPRPSPGQYNRSCWAASPKVRAIFNTLTRGVHPGSFAEESAGDFGFG